MTEIETAKIIGYLELVYPTAFRNIDDEKKEMMIKIWNDQLANDDYKMVSSAVKKLCSISKYIPSIAEIKETVIDIHGIKQMSVGEAWEKVMKNARHDLGQAKSNFNKLPKNIQNALGTYITLREIGLSSPEETGYIRSSFEKKYNEILAHEKENIASGYITYEQVKKNNTLPSNNDSDLIDNRELRRLDFKKEVLPF